MPAALRPWLNICSTAPFRARMPSCVLPFWAVQAATATPIATKPMWLTDE